MSEVLHISEEKKARMLRSLGTLFKQEVPDTPELRRVLALPRRQWKTEEVDGIGDLNQLISSLTSFMKRTAGTEVLWPVQAKALQEAHDYGGLFGPISVGEGKTLITFSAPVLLQAQRPLLIVPARLRDNKTQKDFQELQKHWQSHPDYPVVSYEKLSRESGTVFLQERNPDLLVFDEVHRLKNKKAAVTRRINSWMEDHPKTKVIAMSGTITKRSLMDFAHILRWCLPGPLQPLPVLIKELEAWASVVDEIRPNENRMQGSPGALTLFCNEEEKKENSRDGIRSAIRRRIQETPGVVAYQSKKVDVSLNIVLTLVEGYNSRIEDLTRQMLEGVMPNGDIITDKNLVAKWKAYRTLTSGFWYEWIPPPPIEWLVARKAWRKNVRTILDKNIRGLESEMLVSKVVKVGPDSGFKFKKEVYENYENWLKVKDIYSYETVPVWEDDRMLQFIYEWADNHDGIIWVAETALGNRLEEEGFSYYHQMGLNSKKEAIDDSKPPGCIIASVMSNYEGRNLQAWNDNLVISPFPTGWVWEQMLGREHRSKQLADEVWFEVVIGCKVEWECWKQALKDAIYASTIEGVKRLTYATIDRQFDVPEEGVLWV